jgi:hypothetical protein
MTAQGEAIITFSVYQMGRQRHGSWFIIRRVAGDGIKVERGVRAKRVA